MLIYDNFIILLMSCACHMLLCGKLEKEVYLFVGVYDIKYFCCIGYFVYLCKPKLIFNMQQTAGNITTAYRSNGNVFFRYSSVCCAYLNRNIIPKTYDIVLPIILLS